MLNRGQSTPHLRYPTDSPTQIDARAFPRRHCKGKRGPHHVRQEEPRETKHCSQDSFRGARRRKEPHPASGRRGRRTAPWGKPQMRHRHRYEEDTGEEEEEEGESGGRARGPGNGVSMGHAWAINPRLVCLAGEPLEAPRLHPRAELEGKRSKEAGRSGKTTKATCAEGATKSWEKKRTR
ncbi:unnamed protein product [Prorocentrum cordatum]|uniref:Uncharacterized protein n=1 Tax=Prorocentrum cordatum TaxID=2364126 RepID=A0ABN9WBQ4_9DINO|nr:unnamed protein product [Polarella glacialis]